MASAGKIGVPNLDSRGRRWAYETIQSTLFEMREDEPAIGLQHISVIDATDSVVKVFRNVIQTLPGNPGVRFSGRVFDSPYLEDAYIYRLNQPNTGKEI